MAGWIDTPHDIYTFLFMQTANSTGICHPKGCSKCENVASRLLVTENGDDPTDPQNLNEVIGCVLRLTDEGQLIIFETPNSPLTRLGVIKVFDPTPSANQ